MLSNYLKFCYLKVIFLRIIFLLHPPVSSTHEALEVGTMYSGDKGATRPRVAIAVPKERDQKVKRSIQLKPRLTPSRVDIRPKGFMPSIWVLLWCPKALRTHNHMSYVTSHMITLSG